MLRTALILFLLVLFPLIGLGVVLSSIQMRDTADSAKDWPTVRGKILTSQLIKEQFTIARTCEPRRKAESALAKAFQLATPLATVLDVPVELEAWPESAIATGESLP